ncbi:MAG: SDR family NAD(P)-dependent oxidoreductase [Dehalococcoidia bacterium]
MTLELTGQVAIVTGAGRGIGRAIARRLAESGASVTVAARSRDEIVDTATQIEADGGQALALPVDVTDWNAVQSMVAQTEERFGPADLIVNNAGIGGGGGNFWEADPERWWRTVEVNLRGVALCTRAVLPGMIKRQRGRIVNVASNSAIRTNPYGSDYAGSKAAVLRFTDSVAAEARPYGVHIFAISPGLVRTAMTNRRRHSSPSDADVASHPQQMRTLGPWVPPERAADLCLFLASGRGDALAGHFIHIGDDLDELLRHADRIAEKGLYVLRLPKLDGLAR